MMKFWENIETHLWRVEAMANTVTSWVKLVFWALVTFMVWRIVEFQSALPSLFVLP